MKRHYTPRIYPFGLPVQYAWLNLFHGWDPAYGIDFVIACICYIVWVLWTCRDFIKGAMLYGIAILLFIWSTATMCNLWLTIAIP